MRRSCGNPKASIAAAHHDELQTDANGRRLPSMVNAPPPPGDGDRWALFLDVDGTLVAIAATPQSVQVDSALLPLLTRLREACGGALAVVSGRSLDNVDRLFKPLRLAAAGLHGWERRRADGTSPIRLREPDHVLEPLRSVIPAYTERHPGLLFEDKGLSLALHYRLAPHLSAAVSRFARRLAAQDSRLRLIEGRKVVEFQPSGMDKGQAIAAFMAEPPFLGRLPVYVGDDTTDEDGFGIVNRMHGLSIKVTGHERRARESSAAHYRVSSIAALHAWLAIVAERLGRDADRHPSVQSGTAAIDPALS